MWQPGVQGLPATALQRGVEITQVSFPFFLVTSFCKEASSSKHGQELSETMGHCTSLVPHNSVHHHSPDKAVWDCHWAGEVLSRSQWLKSPTNLHIFPGALCLLGRQLLSSVLAYYASCGLVELGRGKTF